MNAGSIPARTSTELVADVPLAARTRRSRRDRTAWLAVALLLHFLVFAALILALPERAKPPETPAPAEVALLFEGGSRAATPAPPSDRVAPSKAPAPIPGVDAETTTALPPPPAATAAPPTPETAPPTAEAPARSAPEVAVPPSPPLATPAEPATPPTPAAPDIAGTIPLPPPTPRPPADTSTASPEPPRPAATPPPPAIVSREPPRPRPPRVVSRPSPPRVTADGFPTTLMPSFDLSKPSTVTRNAALSPPNLAPSSSLTEDVRGGEALGADWHNLFVAWIEKNKTYPDQAIEHGDEGEPTVSIVVERDGHVLGRNVDLIGRSGSPLLDMGLMSLFRDKHLPPFPPGAPHDRETISVRIHYYLIRG